MSPGRSEEPGLGTFAGVFTPSVLTILGLILFLRLGYVVGNVGLIQSIAILVIATSVSVLTSLSLATAASNVRVGGGGVYFVISRILGVEFGGAVGLVLFVAMSVSVAFYSIGLAEAVASIAGLEGAVAVRLIATGCALVLLYLAWLGADWATRLQYLVMGLLALALVSFFIGAAGEMSASTVGDNLGAPATSVGFWEVFAIFFPAVTGFTQGVAMSGDLRTPSRSIVVGTFLAVGVSTVVYLGAMVALAGSEPLVGLRVNTTTIMGDLSVLQWTAAAGVIAATLSSAMASLLGAPRVLQRIGEDRIVPPLRPFAKGVGPMHNPRRAVLASAGIAFVTIMAGDINTIAPVISMFFLASYGLINYATYFEARAGSTSFRPRFGWYHPRVSLAGAVACALVALAISPVAGAVAGIVLWGIYVYLSRQEVPERWSDSMHAHHYAQARRHLFALGREYVGRRDWRPVLLVFVPTSTEGRGRMLRMATWMEGDTGLTTAVRVIEGSGPVLRAQTREVGASLEAEIEALGLQAFARTVLATDLRAGVQAIIQAHGMGSVRPNTVVFGWAGLEHSALEERHRYGEILQECVRFATNVVVVDTSDERWNRLTETPAQDRVIRVWWPDDQTGQLMTLLAWLCTRSPEWSSASLEVVVADDTADRPDVAARVAAMLDDARIKGQVRAVGDAPIRTAFEGATLAFIPLRVHRHEPLGPRDTPVHELDVGPAARVLVLASDELTLDAEPDGAEMAAHAEAVDHALEAQERAAALDAEASRLLVEAEVLRLEVDGVDAELEPERHRELSVAAESAEVIAAKAYRRYVEARARAEDRRRRADELDPARDSELIDPGAWQPGQASPTSD